MQICAPRPSDDSRVVDAPERLKFLSYSAYGLRIGVEAGFDLLQHLPSPLIPGALAWRRGRHGRIRRSTASSFNGRDRKTEVSTFQVAENGRDVFSSCHIGVAARTLESRIHHYVAASTQAAVFVHAGVVAWGGRAIVIPGPSHSGKSTLVAALVSQGATYYSDEYAVIDLEGRIHAFPREIRLRPDILQQQIAAAPELGDGGPLRSPAAWLGVEHSAQPRGNLAATGAHARPDASRSTGKYRGGPQTVGIDYQDSQDRARFGERISNRARRRRKRGQSYISITCFNCLNGASRVLKETRRLYE